MRALQNIKIFLPQLKHSRKLFLHDRPISHVDILYQLLSIHLNFAYTGK